MWGKPVSKSPPVSSISCKHSVGKYSWAVSGQPKAGSECSVKTRKTVLGAQWVEGTLFPAGLGLWRSVLSLLFTSLGNAPKECLQEAQNLPQYLPLPWCQPVPPSIFPPRQTAFLLLIQTLRLQISCPAAQVGGI